MKIERLRLTGLLRFEDTIDLDISSIPPGTLIAITGPNGAGKTSLIESMFAAWYGELPSRSDRELVDYATRKDSAIDITASFDGKGTYRARMALDGLARTRAAVLERTIDGRTERLNDGKVTTFDKAIARELPAKATVLASAFACQNRRGSFATLDRRGRKDLFSELLGLEHLETLAETSRLAATLIDRRLTELRALLQHLVPQTTPAQADAFGEQGNRLQVRLTTLEHRQADITTATRALADDVEATRAAADEAAQNAERRRALLQEADEAQAAATRAFQAHADLTGELEREAAAIDRRRQQALDAARREEATIPSPEVRLRRYNERLGEIAAEFGTRRADLEERLKNNQSYLDHADAIRTAMADVEEVGRQLAEAEREVEACQAAWYQHQEALRTAERIQAGLAGAEAALTSAESRAQLLERTPFGQQCEDAACPFVSDAIAAKGTLEACRARLEELRDARRIVVERTGDVEQATREHDDATRARNTLREALQRPEIAQVRDRFAKLQHAEQRMQERREQLAQVDRDEHAAIARAEADHVDRLRGDLDQIARLNDAKLSAAAAALAEHDALEQRIQAARDARWTEGTEASARSARAREAADAIVVEEAAEEQHALAQAKHAGALAEAHRVALDLATLEGEIARFESERAVFRSRQAQRERLEASVEGLETHLIEWQGLAKAFGREGLPVVEIDNAGPEITALTNDLLASCFSGRFTVELVTQEAKAKGPGLKETFDLKVYDGEQGGAARNLTDLSGGEQVLVDESLKCAIALYVNQRNQQPMRTWWRDETTGALDHENTLRYVAMLRRAAERGGLAHLFFISHDAEARAMADVQIQIADGRVAIVYPPFDRQEVA